MLPRTWKVFIAALSLSGCMTTAEETKGLMDTWGDCVMSAVIRMDDGNADPVSLAYGIAPQCAVQYQRFTSAEVGNYITEKGQAAALARQGGADDHLRGAYTQNQRQSLSYRSTGSIG
jgi:hypothetical protein